MSVRAHLSGFPLSSVTTGTSTAHTATPNLLSSFSAQIDLLPMEIVRPELERSRRLWRDLRGYER